MGWLRWYYALPAVLLLAIGFVWLYGTDYLANMDTIGVPVRHFIPILLIIMLYVGFSGNCGLGVGGYDIPWRNAILRDMIAFDWPVYYESTGYALCYYFVFWMIPALVGKLLGWIGACVTMWLQEVVIITDAFLLISYLVKAQRPSQYWMILSVFLLWCGLNIFGAAISQIVGFQHFSLSYNADYAGRFYFRNNIDCIEESYNQIVVWLAVPLMLQNRRIHSYLLLGLAVLPFSPWLTAGLIPFMIVAGIMELRERVKRGDKHNFVWTLREVFSPANSSALIVCGIIFGSFFIAALQPGTYSSGQPSAGGIGILSFSYLGIRKIAGFVVFAICQYGLFSALLFRRYRRDPLFWTMIVSLSIIPFIWVGQYLGMDFCMDATLPALTVLMVMMIISCKEDVLGKPLSPRNFVFAVLLLVAMASPVMEICGNAVKVIDAHSVHLIENSTDITTYDGLPLEDCENFVCPDPDSTLFFHYLAR